MPLAAHLTLGWAMVVATLALVGYYVPPAEVELKESYLIFFFHFPSAVNCLHMFLFAGVASLLFLLRRRSSLDHWAASAVEVGVLACTITLVTGSIWARAAWGFWWNVRDPRLMSVAITWLIYVAYLALRTTIGEPVQRARFSAVYGILATLTVPMVLFSIRVLGRSDHPDMAVQMDSAMTVTRWFGAAAFLVLYTALWRLRYRVHEYRHEGNRIEEAFARVGI